MVTGGLLTRFSAGPAQGKEELVVGANGQDGVIQALGWQNGALEQPLDVIWDVLSVIHGRMAQRELAIFAHPRVQAEMMNCNFNAILS